MKPWILFYYNFIIEQNSQVIQLTNNTIVIREKMKKRAGFTMIELIFVIVIIGILAAVAIPKLAATRDDAKISAIIANIKVALNDMAAFYISQGSTVWKEENTTIEMVTNVVFDSPCGTVRNGLKIANEGFYLCDIRDATNGKACIQFSTSDTGVIIVPYPGVSNVCDAVIEDPAVVTLLKTHTFGGAAVSR